MRTKARPSVGAPRSFSASGVGEKHMATTTELPNQTDFPEPELRAARIYWNPTTSMLYMHALKRGDGVLAEGGPLVVDTGKHTGRSPDDKFLVREPESADRLWWGEVNEPIEEAAFESLRRKILDHFEAGEVYVVDAFAGSDPEQRLALRVVTDSPWHALFAKTLFIEPTEEELAEHRP